MLNSDVELGCEEDIRDLHPSLAYYYYSGSHNLEVILGTSKGQMD